MDEFHAAFVGLVAESRPRQAAIQFRVAVVGIAQAHAQRFDKRKGLVKFAFEVVAGLMEVDAGTGSTATIGGNTIIVFQVVDRHAYEA